MAWGFCGVGGWPGLDEGVFEGALLASAHVDSISGCRGGWSCVTLGWVPGIDCPMPVALQTSCPSPIHCCCWLEGTPCGN